MPAPRRARRLLRAATLVVAAALLATAPGGPATGSIDPGHVSPVGASPDAGSERRVDPRKTRGLFVDPLMPAANQGPAYRSLGNKAQALWFSNEYYPTDQVRGIARTYVGRAAKADKTPVLVVYSIPDRDCGQWSAGGLPGAAAYKAWILELARGIRGSHPIVVLEPDAIPFFGMDACRNAEGRLELMRFAAKRLTGAGAWVYLDAGHSDWRPYETRARLLKRAGIGYARGFSTNVSNFRRTADEHAYAAELLADLRRLGITGKRYVVDTSRNGASNPVNGDVINPLWARVGRRPGLVFKGAFDGTLWVKHPGESDGPVNGGPASGSWCDLLADRLLGRTRPAAGC